MSWPGEDELLPVLRAALNQTRSAACITTAELDAPGPIIVYVNPAYCLMTGRTAEEVIGESPRIMQGPLTDRRVLDRLRADLEAGRPFLGETVNYRKDGTPYLINWRIDPVTGPQGDVTHYIATQEDVTRLKRAELLLAAEQAIDRALLTVLSDPADTETNLNTLSTGITAAVSDLVGYGRPGLHGSIILGTGAAPFSSGDRLDPGSNKAAPVTGSSQLETGRDHHGCWIRGSLVNEQTGVDGVLTVSGLSPAEFDFVDHSALERIIENTLRALNSLAEYERQRLLAIELQRDLLPTAPPSVSGIELAALYRPGAFATRIGGDWFDVISDESRAVFFVGDVAGSGVRAAADMGRLRLLARILLQQGLTISEMFQQLNRFAADEDLVATALAVVIELEGGSFTGGDLRVTSAGHPPPIRRSDYGSELMRVAPGPLLGIGGDPPYVDHRFDFSAGDQILMFTDGLFERPDETIDQSLDRLAANVAAAPHAICQNIEALSAWLVEQREPKGSSDDVAVLGFTPAN